MEAALRTIHPPAGRRSWPRVTLTLSPEASDALGAIAEANYRNRKQEALRLLTEGIERERLQPVRER